MITKEHFDKVLPYLVIIALIVGVIVSAKQKSKEVQETSMTIKHDTVFLVKKIQKNI